MKVYKEKQFLVFVLDDGSTVKYDFARKEAIGKLGGYVGSLSNQLRGVTIDDVIQNCTDSQYALFLKWVLHIKRCDGLQVKNIGTVLRYMPEFSRYEQFFSAGIKATDSNIKYTISDIPSGLLKLCREKNIRLTNHLIEYYKQCPDMFHTAFSLEYTTLTNNDVAEALTYSKNELNGHRYEYKSMAGCMLKEFGYTAKALFKYLDYLKTFEALDSTGFIVRELYDYAGMMNRINPRFEKYPKHFLTTHRIATRNFNRLRERFDEELFKRRRVPEMQRIIGEYAIIYPETTDDIKQEAVMQNNCVASYIKSVIDGKCHILFMRHKDAPDKSLVTLEVRDNQVVQAKQHYNYSINDSQQRAIDIWNHWWGEKQKKAA